MKSYQSEIKKKKLLYTVAFLAVVFTISDLFRNASAQQNLILHFSFEAQNMVPFEYYKHARSLPIPGTELKLGVDLFSQKTDGVLTLLDSKNYFFRWYLGGIKISEGLGQAKISYTVP
ncbi:MAG: hypothetical protein ACK4NX_00920, partial [Candidatus Paceibacteria bacterium]